MSEENQFALLKKRRFGPFFLTQSLGAFNDNVFKQALVVLVVFQGSLLANDISPDVLTSSEWADAIEQGDHLVLVRAH